MGLQIGDHTSFHRWERRAQRVGTALVIVLLGLALLGLTGGSGLLSTAVAGDPDRAPVVTYQRFVHREGYHLLTLTVAGHLVAGDSLDVQVAGRWLDRVDLQSITPLPVAQIRDQEGEAWRLPSRPGATLTLSVYYRPDTVGLLRGWARTAGGTTVFDQFVYP